MFVDYSLKKFRKMSNNILDVYKLKQSTLDAFTMCFKKSFMTQLQIDFLPLFVLVEVLLNINIHKLLFKFN